MLPQSDSWDPAEKLSWDMLCAQTLVPVPSYAEGVHTHSCSDSLQPCSARTARQSHCWCLQRCSKQCMLHVWQRMVCSLPQSWT